MILITYFMVLIAFLQCRKIHHTLKAATNKSKVLQGFEDPEIAIREPTAVLRAGVARISVVDLL